ncbi:CDP-alcohol phosphatidyltransferase family protein [Aporhodopirellula aestuarii]|uniref:Phosphatidylcholine synthase n=1 Tax=Aporhodopirellula aestuarii TaxID=2950107 RepID=A0ABT0U9K8_9BACT|nr:CDP-alcohol phosphatidyltransferase family protein [Aporhodopirellula aestuarii]MCM2373662.1 phosphatidylcholine synthase [Aporhodopirellula aestuarii]
MLFNSAYLVHVLTASGIIPAAFAVHEMMQPDCDSRVVFVYLLLATLIDSIDGPLARRFAVKENAAAIDGRVIDDLIDYLTFAFIPLMLIWRMEWMPEGWGFTVVFAMVASLFGFAHRDAKMEVHGVFRGFPSYWNLFAIYAGVFSTQFSPWLVAVLLYVLTVLTVSPVWVLYPNLAPRHWMWSLFVGGLVWTGCLIGILAMDYPSSPVWLVLVSLLYPAFYVFASMRHARTINDL